MGLPRRAGFTLIEVLAVVAILALVSALVAPSLGGLTDRRLRAEAQRIAARLELARQRAIVTGVPHRLWMNIDDAEFRIEWETADPDAPVQDDFAPIDLSGNTPLELSAPRQPLRAFHPIPGKFGNTEVVTDPFYFERLETPEGAISAGEAWVTFDRDGGASYTEIYIEDNAGHALALDIYPIDDLVRVRDEV